jgi:hypothetical protein
MAKPGMMALRAPLECGVPSKLGNVSLVTDDLAYPDFRMHIALSDAERRRLVVRDAFAWIIVAILHLIFFFALVISMQQRQDRIGPPRSMVETILDLSRFNNKANREDILNRQESKEPDLSAKPLSIIPKPPVLPEVQGAPAPPGDVLKSIGEALACGASNFEYLNKAQQARCPRQPWMAARRPDGTIVLDALPKGPPQALQMTGADLLRKQAQTENPCPIMLTRPCLHPTPNLFDSSRGGVLPGILGDGN